MSSNRESRSELMTLEDSLTITDTKFPRVSSITRIDCVYCITFYSSLVEMQEKCSSLEGTGHTLAQLLSLNMLT